MDYVEWCDRVIGQVVELTRRSPTARSMGVDVDALAQASLGIAVPEPGYAMSPQWQCIRETLHDLEPVGLLTGRSRVFWRASDAAREYLDNPVPFWTLICATRLEREQEDLLRVVNRLSVEPNEGFVRPLGVPGEALVRELEWAQRDVPLFHVVADELREYGLIGGIFAGGRDPNSVSASATYRGLVWETRRKFTAESQYIDRLVAEWETTSVEFQQDVQLDTKPEEAEFVKDILGLVGGHYRRGQEGARRARERGGQLND